MSFLRTPARRHRRHPVAGHHRSFPALLVALLLAAAAGPIAATADQPPTLLETWDQLAAPGDGYDALVELDSLAAEKAAFEQSNSAQANAAK